MGAEDAKAVKPVVRTRPWAWALLIILVSLPLLYMGLCSSLDITDDPSRNGGFYRGRIFVLQSPVYVQSSNDGTGWAMREARESGFTTVPIGSRLQIIKVTYLREFVADNIYRAQPLARWLDGPLAGKAVYLQGISKRTPARDTTFDPTILQPADAASRAGAS